MRHRTGLHLECECISVSYSILSLCVHTLRILAMVPDSEEHVEVGYTFVVPCIYDAPCDLYHLCHESGSLRPNHLCATAVDCRTKLMPLEHKKEQVCYKLLKFCKSTQQSVRWNNFLFLLISFHNFFDHVWYSWESMALTSCLSLIDEVINTSNMIFTPKKILTFFVICLCHRIRTTNCWDAKGWCDSPWSTRDGANVDTPK